LIQLTLHGGEYEETPRMTEAEWLESSDVSAMLKYLHLCRDSYSLRKFMLFPAACCRRVWASMTDERSRRAIECYEQCAEGLGKKQQVLQSRAAAAARVAEFADLRPYAAEELVAHYGRFLPQIAAARAAAELVLSGSRLTLLKNAEAVAEFASYAVPDLGLRYGPERDNQCKLIRCIFGNPFPAIPRAGPWLSWNGGVIALMARAIYAEGAFDRLPVLADALEEAGCGDAEILGHCRTSGPHARGCWVLDQALGKE
jgi:hypothetical protein